MFKRLGLAPFAIGILLAVPRLAGADRPAPSASSSFGFPGISAEPGLGVPPPESASPTSGSATTPPTIPPPRRRAASCSRRRSFA